MSIDVGGPAANQAASMKRVALFGGTFDPVHKAHLFLADRARARLELEKVIFIPCRQSPHKTDGPLASDADRLKMLESAIANRPWAEVSRWELDQDGPSYSWRTAQHFREIYPLPEADLYWILGGDQWNTIEHWSRIDLLSDLVVFAVFPRFEDTPVPKAGIRAVFLPDAMELTATEVRAFSASAPGLDARVPEPVAAYIRKHGLYGAGRA